MPGRACCGCCVRTGCDGRGRGPPSIPGVVGRGGEYGCRICPGAPGRPAPAGFAPGVAGFAVAPGGGDAGGWTMRGCETGGRLAGVNGRAGCGALPGSSMRRRIVGGTKRPAGCAGAGACAAIGGVSTGTGSSIGAASSSIGAGGGGGGSSTTTSGTGTTGGAGSGSGAGGGTTATGGGGSMTCGSGAGGGGATGGATASADGDAAGLTILTRRGGPRTGAVGFAGSGFFGAGAFFAPLAGTGCSANMSPLGSEMLR